MLNLYYLPGACSLVPHVALEWTGAEYQAVEVPRDSLQSPEFLALNPRGSVPVLQDGDCLAAGAAWCSLCLGHACRCSDRACHGLCAVQGLGIQNAGFIRSRWRRAKPGPTDIHTTHRAQ